MPSFRPKLSSVGLLRIHQPRYQIDHLAASRKCAILQSRYNHSDGKTGILAEAAKESKTLDPEKLKETPAPVFDLDSIFVLSIPITSRKSFIYCHHKKSLLNLKQINDIPWLVKAESKLVELATKAWTKLVTSELSVNKQIVSFVLKLLNAIPYNENCLRSFPSQSTMIREINEKDLDSLPKAVMMAAVESNAVSLDQLKPIPVYHPTTQSPQAILAQMHEFKTSLMTYHRKWSILCAIGIPLTLPVALVPVVPNVPGFYLAYRLYCHLQALRGAKNLGYLLEIDGEPIDESDDTVTSTYHLRFDGVPELDFVPAKAETEITSEHMVLDSKTVPWLVEKTGLSEIKEDLYRATVQEERRLKREASANTEKP